MAGSGNKNNNKRRYTYYLIIFIICVSIILLFLLKRNNIEPVVIDKAITEKTHYKKLYIVIDDVGHNTEQLEAFLAVPIKMSYAILPGLTSSIEAAKKIREQGRDYILHQPMEAVGGQNPGPGAILLDKTDDEIIKILNDNLNKFPEIIGINNHMGSLITANEHVMKIVLQELKKRNMYFLDSLTSSKSVVSRLADDLGLEYYKRSVFLDNSKEKEQIMNSIEEGLNIADSKGYAVMIGHVWTNELAELLMDIYPELIEKGYSFEDISALFKGKG